MKKRITGSELMPEGDYGDLTVDDWGQREYNAGKKIGHQQGIDAIRSVILKMAGERFMAGDDQRALWLRVLLSELPIV